MARMREEGRVGSDLAWQHFSDGMAERTDIRRPRVAAFCGRDGKNERGGTDGQRSRVATFFRWDGRADRYLSISRGTVLQMGQQGGGKSALNRELVGGRGGRRKGGGTEQ